MGRTFDGDTIDLLLKYFDSDRITIHCYEPSKDNAKRIRKRRKADRCGLFMSGLQENSEKAFSEMD